MSWQNWLRGLVAALVSGAANGFLASVISPETFNASPEGLKKLGTFVILSGAMGGAMYLKQSPVPALVEETKTTEVTKTTTVSAPGPPPPTDPPKV